MPKLNVNKKLSKRDMDILNDFFKKSDNNIYFVDGYLCAIVSSPNLVMPSEWLNDFLDPEYDFENEEQFHLIYELLISFYNSIVANITNETYIPVYDWHEDEEATRLESATKWANGYMLGTMIESEEFLVDEIIDLLIPVVVLTGAIPKSTLKKNKVVPEDVIDEIPLMVKDIAAIYNILK